MTRRTDRYRTNSLSQLEESRIRNREVRNREEEVLEEVVEIRDDSIVYEGDSWFERCLNQQTERETEREREAEEMLEISRRMMQPMSRRMMQPMSRRMMQPPRFYGSDVSTHDMATQHIPYITFTERYRDNETRHIMSYSYRPKTFNFNKVRNEEEMFLGIELEIDKGGKIEKNAKIFKDILGENNCYVVHDGSLEDGMEIVTHPSTLEYHKRMTYREMFDNAINLGYRAHDTRTCGLHVHVNRNYFGDDPTGQDLCITKLLYLMEKHWDDIVTIARRKDNRYAYRFHMDDKGSIFDLLVKAKGLNSSRYAMVNLKNEHTIEFRIFKGTLKYETLIATLEFVNNLCHLCKVVSLENIQSISFEDVLRHRETEYLVDYYYERKSKNA